MSTIELSNDEYREIADWMEDNIEVHLAPGVSEEDVDTRVFDSSVVRELDGESVMRELSEGERLQLSSIVRAWESETEREEEIDGAVFETWIGTSPWRKKRKENPPVVPGESDLVWMEWDLYATGQYHEATQGGDIPVVEGAANAVLTTEARARELRRYACPDCFPAQAAEDGFDGSLGDRKTTRADMEDTEE